VLPLGNASLGLAVVYGGLAVVFLAAGWHEPRVGVFAVLGPLLGPLSALGLLPVVATAIRSPARRVLQVASAVVLAAVAAGIEHRSLPFTGEAPPRGIGVTGSEAPLDVVGSLLRALVAHPALLVEASVLGVAAAVLPPARAKGKWGTTGFAGALLVATILPVPAAKPWPLVLAAWATWLLLTLARRPET
jgi:hypothetical protein